MSHCLMLFFQVHDVELKVTKPAYEITNFKVHFFHMFSSMIYLLAIPLSVIQECNILNSKIWISSHSSIYLK